MGFFATRERLLKPDRIRLVFLAVAVAAFCVTEFGRFVYRPYVRSHGIHDYGLADSIGNLGGIVVQIFFSVALVNATRRQSFRLSVFLMGGYILYEFVQPMLPRGVFDWKDVGGTILGGGVAMILLAILWRAKTVRLQGDR